MPRKPQKPQKFITDLATQLIQARERNGPPGFAHAANPDRLAVLIELAYEASMRTEEGRPLQFRLFLPTPGSAGPTSIIDFSTPIDVKLPDDIVGLSPATIPRSHALALRDRDGRFQCCGIVSFALEDQSERREGMFIPICAVHDGIGGLLVRCDGPGRLRLTYDWSGTYRLEGLHFKVQEPLYRVPFVLSLAADIGKRWVDNFRSSFSEIDSVAKEEVVGSFHPNALVQSVLHRMLDHVLEQKHGGTICILPKNDTTSLKIKHEVSGPDLGELCGDFWGYCARGHEALRANEEAIALLGTAADYYREKAGLDLKIRAVASLANVDGCLVLGPNLETLGFGAKILVSPRDTELLVESIDENADFSIEKLGMRHQSAAHLCAQRPGTVAFVVSQDGTMRTFFGEGQRVVVKKTDAMDGFGLRDW